MSRDANERAKPPGIIDYLFAELRYAIQDIRQKVVEQGWFGRVTTTKPVEVQSDIEMKPADLPASPPLAEQRRPTFEELWGPRERSEHIPDRDRAPERDIEMER